MAVAVAGRGTAAAGWGKDTAFGAGGRASGMEAAVAQPLDLKDSSLVSNPRSSRSSSARSTADPASAVPAAARDVIFGSTGALSRPLWR